MAADRAAFALLRQDHEASAPFPSLWETEGSSLGRARNTQEGAAQKTDFWPSPRGPRQRAVLYRACAGQSSRRAPRARHVHTHTDTHTHSPADVVRREESACVLRNPARSPPKNRLPEELSLLPPHITTERIRLSSGPSRKRSPSERFPEPLNHGHCDGYHRCVANYCSRSMSDYRMLALSGFTMPIPV